MFARVAFATLTFAAYIPWTGAFNNLPGVDIWCGKAYRPTYIRPGWFQYPAESEMPLLDLKIRPRMSIYLESDTDATFLVDGAISYLTGYPIATGTRSGSQATPKFDIGITADGATIPLKVRSVALDSVDNEVPFSLVHFPARLEPYNITMTASLSHKTYTATTQMHRLPQRRDGGSVTRLDSLFGGLSTLKGGGTEWKLIFPYTYYVQWSLFWYTNISTLDEFASMGYNVIHIVPTGDLGDTPFPWDEFEPYLQRADELGLYFQYDVRWDPSNLTMMIDQVTRLRSHPSILLWYTGDEPDGKGDPVNSTAIAYDTIRTLDPYHPISLALNCYDFYYEDYASGADIVLSDVYPISTNTSWSTVYDTPCNQTYGCCGCDDCEGVFEDISNRLDNFARFDDVVGWPKTHWGAPQAFGNETFWSRYPTAAEEVVMNMLSINHGAKGIVMWDFPTTSDILQVTDHLAATLTQDTVAKFLLGAPLTKTLSTTGGTRIDAAAWVQKKQMLLSIINLNYGNVNGNIRVQLPTGTETKSISGILWGDTEWYLQGNIVSTEQLLGLEVSMLILDLE